MMGLKKLVLHVGMHKTGTTSIQNSLATYQSEDVSYLQMGFGNANHSFAYNTLFRFNPSAYYVHVQLKNSPGRIKKIKASLNANIHNFLTSTNSATIISSGEGICHLAPAELLRMKSFFERYFSEVEVQAYIRPPASFMASALQQRVKSVSATPESFLALYPDYRRNFERFYTVFGESQVKLRPFIPKLLVNGDVVQDFAEWNGFDLDPASIVHENLSLPAESVGVLMNLIANEKLCKSLSSNQILRTRLISLLRESGVQKLSLSPDFVLPILKAQSADLDWINSKLNLNIVDCPAEASGQIHGLGDLYGIAKSQFSVLIDRASQLSQGLTPSSQTVALATALLESMLSDTADQ
jgi:hypothetical protein